MAANYLLLIQVIMVIQVAVIMVAVIMVAAVQYLPLPLLIQGKYQCQQPSGYLVLA
jgi:hypothetical protein